MPRPPAPLRDHLLPRVGRVFGLWIPTAFVGIFAIIVALGGPQHRCRPLVVAMAIMHAARWPLSTACMWWYDNREQWSSPATWLKLLQFPSGWPSVSACLAPLLLIHGLWMVRRGGNASLTLLFVWGFYFLTTLLTVDPQYRFWPDFLRDPYVNNGQLFGVFTALVGSFLVTLGAAMTALFLARSWLEFAALLLCGKRPRRDQQVCESCGYSLLHLTSPRCPECGTPIGDQIGVSPTPLTPHDPQK